MILSDLAGHWLTLLVNVACQSVVLGIVWAMAMLVTGRASASLRCLITSTAVVALLALPLTAATIPAWRITWMNRTAPGRAIAPRPPAAAPAAETSLAPPVAGSVHGSTPDSHSPAAQTRPDWALVIFLIWMAGVAVAAMRLCLAMRGVARLTRACVPIDDQSVRRQIDDSGLRRPVRALLSVADCPPLTWGQFHPVLVLPACSRDWPAERLGAVVAHEIAHIRRDDWLLHIAGEFACCLYWFHPLAWMLARRLGIESERACDDCVLLAGVPSSDYATHLVDVLRDLRDSRHRAGAALAMASRQSLVHGRVEAILDARRNRHVATRAMIVLALVLAALLVLPLGACKPPTESITTTAPSTSAGSQAQTDSPPAALLPPATGPAGVLPPPASGHSTTALNGPGPAAPDSLAWP
jgi:beta-lactamase regulating signal transducer with metallopeptidase domain